MKPTLTLCLALLVSAGAARAQIFRSEAVHGAILGGIAGGIIGHNSGDLRHNGWKGAAIGATAGLLIGQAVGDARDRGDYVRRTSAHGYGHGQGGYVYRTAPTVYLGYGHTRYGHGHRNGGHWEHSGFGHYRSPWHRSSGWGVGVVYAPVYGRSYFDGYGYAPSPAVVAQPAVYTLPAAAPAPAAQAATAAPQNVTIINNYYGTPSPMSGANSLFGR